MSMVGRAIAGIPNIRARQWVEWAPVARERVRERVSVSTATAWHIARISALVLVGVILHAWNLFGFPRYQGDEGVYMASAWSLAHGSITPYTYNYGHPPLGWALIALWCELTGGFFTFGTSVNTGRVFMVVIYAVSAIFVYLLALRLTKHWQTAVLATALFSYSPLSITFQREVLLDNIATMWALVAFFLLIVSKSRLRYLLGSAILFGVATLSKETMIVLFPAYAYGLWRSVTPFQRRYLLLVFSYTALGAISIFVLVAALKNELFPTGTLLGGSTPHVSMLATFASQASRGGEQGNFLQQWQTWSNSDVVITVGGVISIVANLIVYRDRALRQTLALAGAIYFLFLARGGVTFAYYIIVMLPLLAINIALLADLAVTRLIEESQSVFAPLAARRKTPDVVALATLVAVLMIGVYQAPLNHTNMTAQGVAPEVAAMQWMSANAPRSSTVIASHYFWLDMHAHGGMGDTYGAPFQNVQMYWNVATDRAILDGVLHNNWNNVDYVIEDSDMAVDAKNFDMTIINQSIAHSTEVARFQNTQFWVVIYQVQHTGGNEPNATARADLITQMPLTGAPKTTHASNKPPTTLAHSFGVDGTQQSTPATPSATKALRVTASELNMRSGPGIGYSIVTRLTFGTHVDALATQHGWVYVRSPNAQGWVASQWAAPII